MIPPLILDWLNVLCKASYPSYHFSQLTVMVKWCFVGVPNVFIGGGVMVTQIVSRYHLIIYHSVTEVRKLYCVSIEIDSAFWT